MAFNTVSLNAPDVVSRIQSRPMSQFNEAANFQAVLKAFSDEVQELLNAIIGVIVGRSPAEAVGAQLDALGRIVGQDRMLWDFGTLPWFAPDNADARPDSSGVAWVSGVPSTSTYPAPDNIFRQLIEAKVFRNFCRYGSVPEIQQAVLWAFGINVGFVRTGAMEVTMKVPTGTPAHIVNMISQFFTDARMERRSLMPFPVTVNIANIQYV